MMMVLVSIIKIKRKIMIVDTFSKVFLSKILAQKS